MPCQCVCRECLLLFRQHVCGSRAKEEATRANRWCRENDPSLTPNAHSPRAHCCGTQVYSFQIQMIDVCGCRLPRRLSLEGLLRKFKKRERSGGRGGSLHLSHTQCLKHVSQVRFYPIAIAKSSYPGLPIPGDRNHTPDSIQPTTRSTCLPAV